MPRDIMNCPCPRFMGGDSLALVVSLVVYSLLVPCEVIIVFSYSIFGVRLPVILICETHSHPPFILLLPFHLALHSA